MPESEDPRYLAMSPRDRASFDALSGGGFETTRTYNPNHGGWYKLDDDKLSAMRDYYTKRSVPRAAVHVTITDSTPVAPRVFALGPGHIPKAICQTSSC